MTHARTPGSIPTADAFRLSAVPRTTAPPVQVAAALASAPPSGEPSRVRAASQVTENAASALRRSVAFRQLPIARQAEIERDLRTIRHGLGGTARAMETPEDFRNRMALARQGFDTTPSAGSTPPPADGAAPASPKTRPATETIAARTGALVDEIDFPGFVAGLVHGTFDAMVDASIRQMEAFADLVSAVAKNVDDFTRDNITRGQVIDSLVEKYPNDLVREIPLASGGGPARLRAREVAGDGDDPPSPEWLSDYGLAGEPLSDEVIEEQLIPAARRRVGESRLQMLATMVLLGMNRVVVKDGTIAAKVRFRAAARDTASVNYAVSQEPGRPTWGERGSQTYAAPATMISTVNANVQTDTDLKAELFGEVRINFVSETVPLEKFLDQARIALLQGNARVASGPSTQPSAPAASPAGPPPASTPPAAPPPAPATATPPAPKSGAPT